MSDPGNDNASSIGVNQSKEMEISSLDIQTFTETTCFYEGGSSYLCCGWESLIQNPFQVSFSG